MIMKKFTAILLTLALMLGLSVNAVAAPDPSTIGNIGDNATSPVTVTVTQPSDVVSVTIDWGAFEFNYTAKWDTDSHTFVAQDDGWGSQSSTLTITNNSNIDIYYAVEYVESEDTANKHKDTSVAVKFDNSTSIVATKLDKPVDANDSFKEITVTPTGTPDVTVTDKITIGNIKVTISASI